MAVVDEQQFKQVMGSFAASVTVLTTRDAANNPAGMTATAFTSVSLLPPLCLVCVALDASCLPILQSEGVLAVNMLRADQEALSNRFASPVEDRFAGIAHRPGPATGCPLLEGAMATLEGKIQERMRAGDHEILLVEVVAVEIDEAAQPLVYHRGRYGTLA